MEPAKKAEPPAGASEDVATATTTTTAAAAPMGTATSQIPVVESLSPEGRPHHADVELPPLSGAVGVEASSRNTNDPKSLSERKKRSLHAFFVTDADATPKKKTSGQSTSQRSQTFGANTPIAMTPRGTPRIKSARETVVPDVEVSASNAHAVSWEQVMTMLETNVDRGLTADEAKARLDQYGKNKLAEKPPEPFWHKVFRQINSVLIYILLIAAIIAGVFQEWPEFGLILGVVLVNMTIGLIQEGKAEKATAALKAMLSSKATVYRDGNRMEILAEDVVPGDLVFIESGNKVPADLRMVEISNLAIQEAMLTGESLPVNKKTVTLGLKLGLGDRKNMAFSATNVIKGQGKGIVVATGDETEIGKINTSVSEVKEEKTHLIKQIDAFGAFIGIMVVPIAIASFCLAYFSPSENQHQLSYAFIEAVAISVAIIPEGLPAIITITLSLGTAYMASHHAIVKTLPAVETLGSVMVICSDKTGTLTKNEMTTVAARTRASLYKVTQVGYDPAGGKIEVDSTTPTANVIQSPAVISADETNDDGVAFEPKVLESTPTASVTTTGTTLTPGEDKALWAMIEGGILCNDSRIESSTLRGNNVVLPVGDPTEVALVTFAEKSEGRVNYDAVRKARPRLNVIPFESEHKFMCTFHKSTKSDTKIQMYVKGAPDRLVAKSSHVLDENGERQLIDVAFWQKQASELSERGLRCLAVCEYEMDSIHMAQAVGQGAAFITEAAQPFLTFLGLAAILDPPRQECKVAIGEAHSAGIVVKMITGDHPGTARAIGEQLGIVDAEHPLVKTGPELDAMSFEELRQTVLVCNVYARASPENKISIVRALQAEQKVCSMTGDGVNDAPALRAADIGVAMGITGTDVSKDAAKMILTDDNFATILVAVKEGRRVWDNLKKLLIFNMPMSFAQGGVVFFALCLQMQNVPLSAIQILYVNMITACTLGLMLAVEPAENDIMERPPRKASTRLLGFFFYWRSFFVATVLIFFVLGSVAWINAVSPPYQRITTTNTTVNGVVVTNTTNTTVYAASDDLQHAIALNTLVFCETTYAFNCRFLKASSLHPRVFRGNRLAWLCALVMIGLQLLITYVPGLNTFFSMSDGMTAQAWGIAVLFAVLTFLIVELEKALAKPLEPLTRPIIERIGRARIWRCCNCSKGFKKLFGIQDIDYEPRLEPKKQSFIPPKFKQGASLRFDPEELSRPKETV